MESIWRLNKTPLSTFPNEKQTKIEKKTHIVRIMNETEK